MLHRRHLVAIALSCAIVAGAPRILAHEVVAPKPKAQPSPEWPQGKRETHDVVVPVVLTVGEDGRISAASVESSVSPEFDAAALEGVKAWTFEPAMRDGKPVAARIRSVVRFASVSHEAPAVHVAPVAPRTAPATSVDSNCGPSSVRSWNTQRGSW